MVTQSVRGDSWAYPSKDVIVNSANGRFRFTALVPPRNGQSLPYHTLPGKAASSNENPYRKKKVCVGLLEELRDGKMIKTWKNQLINLVSPLEAMITENGAYVVTFDTWFGVGADPIVIYNSKGKLVRRHSLESLGLTRYTEMEADDRSEPKITGSISSVYWLDDGFKFFNEDQSILIIHLSWGHYFGILLKDGALLSSEKLTAEEAFITRHLHQQAASLLYSRDMHDRKQGARLAGIKGFKEFIPRLRELLGDPDANTGKQLLDGEWKESFRQYRSRAAARDALLLLGDTPPDVIVEERFFGDANGSPAVRINHLRD